MRLIEIYANQAGFKRVRFNQTGVSLILGSRSEPEKHGDDKSYNGVGKSLLAEIVHFCLGSTTNKAFKQHLPEWEFTLVFSLGDKEYQATRSTGRQGEVYLGDKKLSLKAYTDFLSNGTFHAEGLLESGQLSFRALVPRFIRRSKADYNDPRMTSADREPYTVLLRNLFLLGLDTALVEKKYSLRNRQVQLEIFEKNFKSDPFIREYYTGNKDASLQAKFLDEQCRRLEEDLRQFKVADDYYDIEKSANEIQSKLRALKNARVVAETSLKNLARSLELKKDIPLETVKNLYGELLTAFRPEALKSLAEVENFHSNLIANRAARLSEERRKIERELSVIEQEIKELNLDVDRKLSYLSDKRALDQYAAVSAQLSDIKAKLHKLLDYQQLLHNSREESARIKVLLAEEDLKTNEYLDEVETQWKDKLSVFSDLARRFYPNSPAGITLSNNSGDNKIRYDFDVRIEADGSDGIGAVKLFCYDLAVAILRANHTMRIVWHDSRLFSDIDPRQRAVLFQAALELSKQHGFQYIATVNEDQIETIEQELPPGTLNDLYESIVLRLKDDGPEGKLLGRQIDMHYQ